MTALPRSAIELMVARRVKLGSDETSSRILLNDLMRRHSGDNLAAALVHWSFATERQAYKYIELSSGTHYSDFLNEDDDEWDPFAPR